MDSYCSSFNLITLFFNKSLKNIDNLYLFVVSVFLSNIYTYLSLGIFLARKNNYFWIPVLSQILIMFFPGIYLIKNYGLEGMLITEILKFLFYLLSGFILSKIFYNYPKKILIFIKPILSACLILFIFNLLELYLYLYLIFLLKFIFII